MALCNDLGWWGGDRETQEGRGVYIYSSLYISYYNMCMIYIMMSIYIYIIMTDSCCYTTETNTIF